jgi:hypothetical protein
MKYKEEFSDDGFKEMYNISKNITTSQSKRNLDDSEKKQLLLKKI